MQDFSIAVLIPCFNEALTIRDVVHQFRTAVPAARVYVYDNNSTDHTARIAMDAGADVRSSPRQGKGNVIRHMFADIEADVYVLVDGDATYDSSCAPGMIQRLMAEHLDMVVGVRDHHGENAYRVGHRFGNKLLTGAMRLVFGGAFTDVLSGYRVFSRRFVKSFPAESRGFETETELTIHAMELRMPCGEERTPYNARPEGSVSKLHTVSDGIRILSTIVKLFAVERPLQFYSLVAGGLIVLSVSLSVPLIITYVETGLVPRFPTAILCTGLSLLGAMTFFSGLTQHAITVGRREARRFQYLHAGTVIWCSPMAANKVSES